MIQVNQINPLALKKPPNREALRLWVDYFFGFNPHTCIRCFPKPSMTPEEIEDEGLPHNCQLDYISSCFFEEHEYSLLTGARSAGKTDSEGVCICLDCIHKPGIAIMVVAFTELQANEVRVKIEKFLESYKEKAGYQSIKEVAEIQKGNIKFVNGSTITFRTGSGKANVKSFHPDRLYIDECDLFKDADMATMENSLTARDFGTQCNFISTSYSMSEGSVVVSKIEAFKQYNANRPEHMKPNKVFRICLLDILETCDSRYKCYDEEKQQHCMLWDFCKGKAKDIPGGYYKISEAIKKLSGSVSKRAFDSEMLLKTPLAENAYFPSFSSKHIIDPPKPYNPGNIDTQISFDFGGVRCPHAAIITQRDVHGTFSVVAEYEGDGNFEKLIERIKGNHPNIEKIARCFIDPAGNIRQQIAGSKSYKDVLTVAGFNVRSSTDCKRKDSFDLLESTIAPADGKIKLFVNKNCKGIIRQIRQAQRTKEGKPVDGAGDDLLDCLRYTIWWTLKKTPQIMKRWKY